MKMDAGFLLSMFQPNTVADYMSMSRTFNENTEWKLSPFFFQSILQRFQFIADIDLFASYLNKQLSNYVSWHPDPESVEVDAFSLSWTKLKVYAFPPFRPVGKSISKVSHSGESVRSHVDSMVGNPKLVLNNDTVACGLPYHSPKEECHIDTTAPREQATSTVPQTPASSHTFIREAVGNQGLQEKVMDIICLSWRDTTTSCYEGVLRQCENYLCQRGVNPLITDVKNVLDFLHGMYKLGCR